ncbi:hypothetical protein, partial [Stappia sp.]|uniref:hypothetical protein n=1 Tax=Stappia sp. TaxID=1870903 RepID=UPI003A98FAAB
MAVFGVFEGLTAAFASGAAGLTAYALARWPEVAARTGAARGPNAATVGHGGKGPAADAPVADANPDAASARAPYPIWRCDATGRVLWGNAAFR